MSRNTLDIEVHLDLLEKLGHPFIKGVVSKAKKFGHSRSLDSIEMTIDDIPTEAVEELLPVLTEQGDSRSARALRAIMQFRQGDFDTKVPNYKAFKPGLESFLRANHIRGWLFFMRGENMLPAYIDQISTFTPRNADEGKPNTSLRLSYFAAEGGRSNGYSMQYRSFTWEPAEVTHKTIPEILTAMGLFTEDQQLLDAYDSEVERFYEDIAPRFAQQMVIKANSDDDEMLPGGFRRAIHNLDPSEMRARPLEDRSGVLNKNVPVPMHPYVHCFDLHAHSFHWVHVNQVQPYVYDPSLREKLILPTSHRDLLDVLTADLSVFSGGIIRGKSAGNIIVCKGLPGLGKTLTAEVYSELTETPIYSVHAGSLGVSADSVERALKVIFKRQKRWGCIVLLDEADVFVKSRGDDLVQNAIVAEFLRTLEYFDGLMFMTTNRPDDIDEAIISRAAAIISYEPPSDSDRAKIWAVMFNQNGITPDRKLIGALTEAFPEIAPRDIKMLLRLALRVATAKEVPLDITLFKRVAMFRAIKIHDPVEDDLENLI